MHYQISEEAFYHLESARNQLRFVATLGGDQPCMGHVAAVDMLAFMDAQQTAITSVLDEAIFHVPPTKSQQPPDVSPAVMVQIIEAVSGAETNAKDLDNLYEFRGDQQGSNDVFRAFVQALKRQGYSLNTMTRVSKTSAAPARKARSQPAVPKRKRDTLTAGAV